MVWSKQSLQHSNTTANYGLIKTRKQGVQAWSSFSVIQTTVYRTTRRQPPEFLFFCYPTAAQPCYKQSSNTDDVTIKVTVEFNQKHPIRLWTPGSLQSRYNEERGCPISHQELREDSDLFSRMAGTFFTCKNSTCSHAIFALLCTVGCMHVIHLRANLPESYRQVLAGVHNRCNGSSWKSAGK